MRSVSDFVCFSRTFFFKNLAHFVFLTDINLFQKYEFLTQFFAKNRKNSIFREKNVLRRKFSFNNSFLNTHLKDIISCQKFFKSLKNKGIFEIFFYFSYILLYFAIFRSTYRKLKSGDSPGLPDF